MTSLKEKGIHAFIWDFSGNILTHGMGLIISIILARILHPSEFGLLAMVFVIIGMAQIFTDTGLGSALIQRNRLLPVHYSSVFYFNLFTGTLLCAITYISASKIGVFYDNDQTIPITKVLSFLFIINALSSVQTIKLKKDLKLKSLAKLNFSASLVSGIIGIYLALNGAGVWSLVAQTLSSAIIFNILIWSTSKWTPTMQISLKALKNLWKFGFHLFLASLMDNVLTRIDIVIIGKMFLLTTLGYYQRAKTLNTMVTQYSSSSLMAVLFPVLSRVKNDLPKFQNIVIKSLGIISFVSFLLLGLLFTISGELIILLFSDKWMSSIVFFKILVLSSFGLPISVLLVNVLMSRGKSKHFLVLTVIKKSLFVINLYVGFSNGIEFFLYGLIVVTSISVILNSIYASREIKLNLSVFLKPILIQIFICAMIVVSVELLFQITDLPLLMSLIAKSIIFTSLYLALNKLLNTDSYINVKEQISPLLHQLNRS